MNHRPFHSRSDCKVRVHFCSQSDESEPLSTTIGVGSSFLIRFAFGVLSRGYCLSNKIKILKFASLMLCIGGRGANPISLELKIEA